MVFFPVPLILTCLAPLRNTKEFNLSGITEPGLRMIVEEIQPDGAFNYHRTADSSHFTKMYPDDLDDTALAYATLRLYRPESLNGSHYARLTQLLISSETAVGGPYNTWLTDFKNNVYWQDIDPAVNANIAFLLTLCGVRCPRLRTFFEDYLKTGCPPSRYYHSPLAILYFLSRAYQGLAAAEASRQLRRMLEISIGRSPLHTALAIISLLRWNQPLNLNKCAAYLLQTQSANGDWKAEAFYLETEKDGQTNYYGHRALTTAFCLEALALLHTQATTKIAPATLFQDEEILRSIKDRFVTECALVSRNFGDIAEQQAAQLLKHPFWREAILWSRQTAAAIGRSSRADNELHTTFGVAQLFGLSAYGIIDDLIDRQGSVIRLPFTLLAARRCSAYYQTLWPDHAERFMGNSEQALAEEAAGKIPTDSAAKSLGCALPALATLARSGADSATLVHFEEYFRQLLRSRQWSDDAHDYLDDIAAGRHTPVTALLSLYRGTLDSEQGTLTEQATSNLHQVFWEQAFPLVGQHIEQCLVQASVALSETNLLFPEYFQGLIEQQKASLCKARLQRSQTLSFLETYSAHTQNVPSGEVSF